MKIILDPITKKIGEDKLSKTLSYCEGRYIRYEGTNDDHDISLLSTIKNTVINSEQYEAGIYNKVEALQNLAQDNNLSQLFVTLTLPTEYHRFINKNGVKVKNKKFAHGHIKLYDIFTKEEALSFSKPIFKYYKTTKQKKWTEKVEEISLNPLDYSAHGGYRKLVKMFSKIQKDRSWMEIETKSRIFFYTIEPTENLTPHAHFSIWLPSKNLTRLIETFFRFYPNPLAHIYTNKVPKELSKKYKSGLEKSDKYIVNYPIKYLKGLRDKEGKVSDLALWYYANKITPFSSSRTLLPQDIYRKIGKKKTLYYATLMYRSNGITAWNNALSKKLMKIFMNGQVAWTHTPSTMQTKYHPIRSTKTTGDNDVY